MKKLITLSAIAILLSSCSASFKAKQNRQLSIKAYRAHQYFKAKGDTVRSNHFLEQAEYFAIGGR